MRSWKLQIGLLATLLAGLMWFEACTVPAWVSNAEQIAETAVPIAGSIVSIVDPAAAPVVALVEQGFNALTKTLDTYKASPTATNLQAVESAFAAVNTNVAQLEQASQIKNAGTQNTVTQVVALLTQAVAEIGQYVPAPAAAKMGVSLDVFHRQAKGMRAKDFKSAYNKIAKTDGRLRKL
jgi:hypothetical protein